MARITVEGEGVIECAEGRRLVLCIEDAGVDILHRCGGFARCTTCRVAVLEGDSGEMNEGERARLAREDDLAPGVRLSCQMVPTTDLSVRVLQRLSTTGLDDPGPRPEEW